MKLGDGLFLNTFRRVAEEYKSTGIEYNDMIVDNTYVAVMLVFVGAVAERIRTGLCSWSHGPRSLMSWSCPTCMAPLSPTLVLLLSEVLVSSPDAMSAGYVPNHFTER